MEITKEMEEKLLEAAHIGDIDTVNMLIKEKGVNVNAQHKMNKWTALHWASKRGHASLVSILVSLGADASLLTDKGESALQLAIDPQTRFILGADNNESPPPNTTSLPITPNYLAYPEFPYMKPESSSRPHGQTPTNPHAVPQTNAYHHGLTSDSSLEELVLKARIANTFERDFIEIELERTRLTFENLMTTLCQELEINRAHVVKVRRLPDTILRKDKDVKRLRDFQEIEVVLKSRIAPDLTKDYSAGPQPRHVDVVY